MMFVEHMQRYVPLSLYTMYLMGISITMLGLIQLYHLLFDPHQAEKQLLWMGIIVRVLMFAAITIEFVHHFSHYSLQYISYWDADTIINQYMNILFYSYIVVAGIHYILSLPYQRWFGFFYTFDLFLVLNPILLILPGVELEEFFRDPVGYLFILLVLSLVAALYLFFELYWRRGWKVYGLFFLLTGAATWVVHTIPLDMLVPVFTFLLLLGMYEGTKHFIWPWVIRHTYGFKRGLRLVLCNVPLLLIMSANPFYNVWLWAAAKASYPVELAYREEVTIATLNEVEQIARQATGNWEDNIIVMQGYIEDFHNIYRLRLGEYHLDFNGVSGKLLNLSRSLGRDEAEDSLLHSHSTLLNQEKIKAKTIDWLASVGYTFHPEYHHMDIEEERDHFSVHIYRKWSDGELQRTEHDWSAFLRWSKTGQIDHFSSGIVFMLDDYEQIKLSEEQVEQVIRHWYEGLGQPTPAYQLSHASFWYDGEGPSLWIDTGHGDRLTLSGLTGDVLAYNRADEEQTPPEQAAGQRQTAASDIAAAAEQWAAQWVRDWYDQPYTRVETEEPGLFSWQARDQNSTGLTRHVDVTLDEKGALVSFNYSVYADREETYQQNRFPVSRQEALQRVKEKYPLLSLYAQRIKLACVINRSGEVDLKWLVVLMPFATQEHHLYFVDVQTGEITPLADYKQSRDDG
ncbi:hypothetical protein [Caldalkalibacillus uzonensis]|nr:hypothetical protein [Caldalkalibacillus uzonensis]